MRSHDLRARQQAADRLAELTEQYLAAHPDADMDAVLLAAVRRFRLANVSGVAASTLSVNTKAEALRRLLAEPPESEEESGAGDGA